MEKNISKLQCKKFGNLKITKFVIILSFLCAFSIENLNAQNKNLNVVEEFELTDEELKAFKQTTRDKISELETCIKIIGDKKYSSIKKKKSIETALKLFIPDAKMQVSSLRNGRVSVNTFPMETYFMRLKSLPYSKVKISFYDLAYISDFQKGADGKYYATAFIFQKFEGFYGDNLSYEDKTQKTIDITLELREDPFFKKKRWVILLGDVKVTETKK